VGSVFSKLLKRKSVPSNDGKTDPSDMDKLQFVKSFELELSNMEDAPVYSLTHQISIGSEIGNIIISDPSVSPRHATFILQQEVVSVIDHGSVAGTSVNGKKIPPGKYIILEESDVVRVGDLELRLKVSTQTAPAEVIPEPPSEEVEGVEEVIEEKAEALEIEAVPERVVVPKVGNRKLQLLENAKKNKTQKTKKKTAVESTDAANSLVRLFAVIGDVLLAYSVLVIFLPFDEFRGFLDFVPGIFSSIFGVEWNAIIGSLIEDSGVPPEMIQDITQFFAKTFNFGPLLIVFIFIRLITTLIMGVSFSEFALGIRATGNGIWARVGGVLRVLIGIVTGPFLIFDVPAIVSKRTFKEFMTFTRITLPSNMMAILGIFLFIPFLIALSLISPLIQGFESPDPIVVNDKIEQRVKVKVAEPTEGAVETSMVSDSSDSLNLELSYDPKELTIIPKFKFQGVKARLNLKSSLLFYQKDLQRTVEMETFKNFDLRQLLGIGMKGNVQLFDKYPEIYNFVFEHTDSHPSFKAAKDAKSQAAFANEFINFTKMAFSISSENALEIMQTDTLLIKGLVDYKSSFLSLIEYKDFDQIGFIKIGNIVFIKIHFNKQKPFDLIIPIIKGNGRIFKINYDSKENLDAVTSKFYKFNLEKSNWLADTKPKTSDVLSSLGAYDFFSSGRFREKPIDSAVAQSLYAHYFEASGAVLSKADPVELELWKSNIKNLPKLLEAIPAKPPIEGEEDPRNKLLLNFQDMIDALENNNFEYFGITQTSTI
jgi:pSer/pThr/pTyr-binding forkhead associated (FHA) protein